MSTPCAICGNHDVTNFYVVGKRQIVRCDHDGLVYVDPQPTDKTLDRWYNEGYFTDTKGKNEEPVGYYAYLEEKPLLLSYFKKKVASIEHMIPAGKVLEVGCGYGFFLEAAKRSSLHVTGIDVSRDAIAYAKKHGGNVWVSSLTSRSYPKHTFDGVVAFQVIEHLRFPSVFFRDVYGIVKPGGMVLFATPNEGGYLRKCMGKRWIGFRHKEHLFFFSPKTIRLLLTDAGFTDIRTHGDTIRWYPIRLLLQSAPNYIHARWFAVCIRWIQKGLKCIGIADIQIPLPLNTLVITARKPI